MVDEVAAASERATRRATANTLFSRRSDSTGGAVVSHSVETIRSVPGTSLLVDRQDSSPECGCPSRPTWRHGISICPHAFAHAASHTPHIRDRPPKMAQLIPAYEIDRAQHTQLPLR